jgi:hypothetical protein
MWGLLLFLGSLFMFTFFWFFYLRNDKANAAKPAADRMSVGTLSVTSIDLLQDWK